MKPEEYWVFDLRQGDNEDQLEIIRWTKKEFPKMQVIGGNVVAWWTTIGKAASQFFSETALDVERVNFCMQQVALSEKMATPNWSKLDGLSSCSD